MDSENIQIISKLEPIECEDPEDLDGEVVREIHVETNTDGNLQINAYEEEGEIPDPG